MYEHYDRHNFGHELTNFVGRDQEIETCKRLLQQARILTLIGPGGSGKTRLAAEIGRQVLDEYQEGAWLVELAAISDPAQVPQAISALFKLQEEPNLGWTDALLRFLRTRQLLLVVDNCEHLTDACAHLLGRLLMSCPQLRILATSREVLGIPGEVDWAVPSLAFPSHPAPLPVEELLQYDAIRLFVERVRLYRPDFQLTAEHAPAVASICRRLDGLPLAIELAAARMRILSAPEIDMRLSDRFRLLINRTPLVPARQQTLEATVDWSYQLLSPEEQLLWHRLSLFVDLFSLEAVEGICSDGHIERQMVLDLLFRLMEKSVVVGVQHGEQMRYRMLETIRQFGFARLCATNEEQEIRQRYIDWYITYIEEAKHRKPAERVERLAAELSNIRQAVRWAEESGQIEYLVRTTFAVYDYGPVRSVLPKSPAYLHQLAAEEGAIPSEKRIKVLLAASYLAAESGLFDLAERFAHELLDINTKLGDKAGVADALNSLALTAHIQKEYERAIARYRQVLEIWKELGDRRRAAHTQTLIGGLFVERREYAQASLFFDRALDIYLDTRNAAGEANVLTWQGRAATEQGRYDQAHACYERALNLWEQLKLYAQAATVRSAMGLAYRGQRQYGEAARLARVAFVTHWEMQHWFHAAEVLVLLAGIELDRLRFERAARLAGAAAHIRQHTSGSLLQLDTQAREKDQALMRQRLGEAAFEAAWAEGRAMTNDALFAYATQPDEEEVATAAVAAAAADESAKASQDEPSQPSWRQAAEQHGLTEREAEVVHLVVRGLSRLEIAQKLYLSDRTVQAHEQHIRDKVGLRNRQGLAIWGVQHGFGKDEGKG